MKHSILSFLVFIVLIALVILGVSAVLAQETTGGESPVIDVTLCGSYCPSFEQVNPERAAAKLSVDVTLCGSYCPDFSSGADSSVVEAQVVRVSLAQAVRGDGIDVTLCGSYCPNLQPFAGSYAKVVQNQSPSRES